MAGFDTQGLPDDTQSVHQRFEASQAAATILEGHSADEFFAYIRPPSGARPVHNRTQDEVTLDEIERIRI